MKRKLIALATAALLVVGTVPSVFAASTAETGNTTVTGDGDVDYLNLEIFSVILPTSDSLDFTLDPQGLANLEEDVPVALADLQGGNIIPSAPASIINNSFVKTKVIVKLKGITAAGTGGNTATATFIAPSSTDPADAIEAVNTGTANNVLLYAVPSAQNLVEAATADTFVRAGKGYALSADDQELTFILDGADYTVTKNGDAFDVTADDETGHGTGILIGGYVNKKANWSNFSAASNPSTVTVQAVFSYAKDDTASPVYEATGIPSLLEPLPAFKYLTLAPPIGFTGGDPLNGGTLNVTKGMNVYATLDFNFGGKTVTEVKFNGTPQASGDIPVYYVFDAEAGKVGFKGKWATAQTGTLTFKLSGDDATVYTFAVNVS
jgi:hypothetical protein